MVLELDSNSGDGVPDVHGVYDSSTIRYDIQVPAVHTRYLARPRRHLDARHARHARVPGTGFRMPATCCLKEMT